MDSHVILALFHLIFVVPLFLWVGIQRSRIPDWTQTLLLVLGIIVTLYHAFKAQIRYTSNSAAIWINLIHALWVGPLLLQIGATKKEAPRSSQELLLMTGFAALGYHLYSLASSIDFL